ncbi:MAG: hypothetical protein GXX94_00170 [Chloroflexi bacterium]|nr:hypothetical protein [Chloroflexota bacterium]
MHSVTAANAPAALGHYSHAIVSGGLVFVSGQLPINPESGEVEADTIEGQVACSLDNVSRILASAGSGMDRVVKATIFISDMSLFSRANAAYAAAFGEHRPARSAVPTLLLPRGALVEIEVIAEVTADA